MVSRLPNPTQSQTPSPVRTLSDSKLALSARTWIGAALLLPLIGMIIGAIATGIGMAIIEVYSQVSTRTFGDLLELLTGIILSLLNILGVVAASTVDGAMIGLYSGGAVALMLLLLALLRWSPFALRPLAMVMLACAGAVGAAYGAASIGTTTETYALLAFAGGGLLCGLLAALFIVPRQHLPVRAQSHRTSRRIPAAILYLEAGIALAVVATLFFFFQGTRNANSTAKTNWDVRVPSSIPITPKNTIDLVELSKIELNGVSQAIFSADGITLAVATGDGVRLYDSATLMLRQIIATGPSRRIALSPDGAILATIADRDIQLWQVADGTLIRTLSGHTRGIEDLVWSPDGQLIASASLDRTVRTWQVSTGDSRHILRHVGSVYSLAFSSDSDLLVTGSNMGTTLWDSSTGIRLALLDILFATVHGVSFTPDDQRIAAVTHTGILRIWESNSHLRLHSVTVEDSLRALGFDPDGQMLAVAGTDQQVHLLQVTTGTIVRTLSGHQGIVSSVAFHPAGHVLATTASDGTLRLWGNILNESQPDIATTVDFTPTALVTATAPSTPTALPTATPRPRTVVTITVPSSLPPRATPEIDQETN